MNEIEAIKEIETSLELAEMCTPNREREKEIKAYKIAIKALEEVQKYRAIGTVEELQVLNRIAEETAEYVKEDKKILEAYKRIGTIDEFKALKEKENEHEQM